MATAATIHNLENKLIIQFGGGWRMDERERRGEKGKLPVTPTP